MRLFNPRNPTALLGTVLFMLLLYMTLLRQEALGQRVEVGTWLGFERGDLKFGCMVPYGEDVEDRNGELHTLTATLNQEDYTMNIASFCRQVVFLCVEGVERSAAEALCASKDLHY